MVSTKLSRLRRGRKASERIKSGSLVRLSIHRTPRHIYAQAISHEAGQSVVLVQASTLEKDLKGKLKATGNINAAETVGTLIAERLLEKGVKQVAFDRRGFKYHGRVAALADAARKTGLKI